MVVDGKGVDERLRWHGMRGYRRFGRHSKWRQQCFDMMLV